MLNISEIFKLKLKLTTRLEIIDLLFLEIPPVRFIFLEFIRIITAFQ